MKIVLIAPGFTPLPPTGWGACESIVWDYYENLIKKGYQVQIVNYTDINIIINEINNYNPDIVHIMYDDYISIVPNIKCNRIFYTTHYAYITHPQFEALYSHYFHSIFKKAIEYSSFITMNVISEQLKQVYIKYGFPENKINVICNGAREDLFKFSENPINGDLSIYIAKIEYRKCQYKYQQIKNIHFVGNYHDSPFDINNNNYLGEWKKNTLYENLTEYGNLILLSEGEADPLVIKEALIAGLGVVISECSSANLDLSKPYITVIPNDKLNDIDYVSQKIEENRKISLENRKNIREYALENFAWDKIINKYCSICL